MNAKNKKLLTVAGIAGAGVAAWYFLFRTRAGAAVVQQTQQAISKVFDLAPSFGTPEWTAYAGQTNALLNLMEQVINTDFGPAIKEGDRAEVAQIVATRLMRNYKTLDIANRNTVAQLVRMDPAYQKMLAQFKQSGAPWAGGSVA